MNWSVPAVLHAGLRLLQAKGTKAQPQCKLQNQHGSTSHLSEVTGTCSALGPSHLSQGSPTGPWPGVPTKAQTSLHTRKILCILIVAEQKINLVRSKRRNSSPKNWRKDWSVQKAKKAQFRKAQTPWKAQLCLARPYLWIGSGSAAGQCPGWFFWGNPDTSPTILGACLIIQRQTGMPLTDCSERVWRGYPAETDLKGKINQ